MLRKNPALRPSASELLKHSHLRPYVLDIHLKSNNPRRHTLPTMESDTDPYSRKTRLPEADSVRKEKRLSFGNNRALNPSISGNELDSNCSSRRVQISLSHLNDNKFSALSMDSVNEVAGMNKLPVSKLSSALKTPRFMSTKPCSNLRRQLTPSRISNPGSTRELLPILHTPARKPSQIDRRSSLPLSTRAANTGSSSYKPSIGLLHSIESPNVSVNAPRLDKMVDFATLSSSNGHPLLTSRRNSSISAQCSSSTSPDYIDRSITKDKCMVQILDRTLVNPQSSHNIQYNGSECSEHNPISGGGSSSDSRLRRFDTSSYQQRAEALEGLLEFSAQLLQQERFDELQVLLKPFGPENVSPRETAIWLTKSFKENTA